GGVGNIYATEALWFAGIHPARQGQRISSARLEQLATCVRDILMSAIANGGTTLRDFAAPDGALGDYVGRLQVYGREGLPCPRCEKPLQNRVMAKRSTVFCAGCQR